MHSAFLLTFSIVGYRKTVSGEMGRAKGKEVGFVTGRVSR